MHGLGILSQFKQDYHSDISFLPTEKRFQKSTQICEQYSGFTFLTIYNAFRRPFTSSSKYIDKVHRNNNEGFQLPNVLE